VVLVGCGLRGSPGETSGAGFSLSTIGVSDGGRAEVLKVEVASDAAGRALGLMYRQDLEPGRGMLFLYPRPTSGGHWMKNTYVPLDIAYADSEGVIFSIVQGRPLDETVINAEAPFVYVLEVPAGWFEGARIGLGARLDLPLDLPVAE